MKFRSFFDIVSDARDIVDLFEGVETQEQMISRLERLKRRDAEEFLIYIHSLRVSVNAAMDDTMEMGGRIDEGDEEGDEFNDDDLEGLEEEVKKEEAGGSEKPQAEAKADAKT